VRVVSAADPQWIFPFTGLQPVQFRRLVRAQWDGRPSRPWSFPLADRVLLVAACRRIDPTLRQVGPLSGVSPV
jgi:hypothetical protein